MGEALFDLEELLRSKKVTLTSKEENLLSTCKSKAVADFFCGLAVGSGVAWLATLRLNSLWRANITAGAGVLWSLRRFIGSLDSSMEHILAQDGSQIQKELATIIVNKYRDNPWSMTHLSKHFYSEKIYDDSTSEQPKIMWRSKNFYSDYAAHGQETRDSDLLGEPRSSSHHYSRQRCSYSRRSNKEIDTGSKQIPVPGWRNILTLKNLLLLSPTQAQKGFAFYHSTPISTDKWRNNSNNDDTVRAPQQSKSQVKFQIRQKRADAKKALKDLLFSTGLCKFPFANDGPMWTFNGTNEWGGESDTKDRSKFSANRSGKSDRKKMKRKLSKHRREKFSDDSSDENIFQEKYGKRWSAWSFQSRKGSSFESSTSGFEWRDHSNQTNHRTKIWENISDVESDEEELCEVGSSSDRTILGLSTTGRITLEDVKVAFRSSALKWHPDKHQGPSQAMAEERFKSCLHAYNSLCDALS